MHDDPKPILVAPAAPKISDEAVARAPEELKHLLGARVTVVIGMTPDGRGIGPRGTCLAVTREFLVLETELEHSTLTFPWSKVLNVEQRAQRGN